MPSFFWIAQIANTITFVVALAALLIVVWLGPRRWTNLSFATFLLALMLWMGASFVARLQVNFPQLGGAPEATMSGVALGFALLGITLFWFVESFYRIARRWRWAANLLGAIVYGVFVILLMRNEIVTDVGRGSEGGIVFDITPAATMLSAVHYLYDFAALGLLLRHRAWRNNPALLIGTIIVVSTSVIALVFPAIALQTYMIAVGTLFLTYEVVRQQLFNPLVQLNRHLEAEVQRRTAELARSMEAQERVRSELATARTIQLSLLPQTTPSVPHLRVAGYSFPAEQVGGDFFTYRMQSDGSLGVAVGDASGKGIPAALLMALALNTYETLAELHTDQGALLTACNMTLAPRMLDSKQNAAFLSLTIDGAGRCAAVANAGLIAPLLWRDGSVHYIDSIGLPLGAHQHTEYQQLTLALQPGDCLLVISDGIVEAMNARRELWGFARLEAVFAAHGQRDPGMLLATILAEVRTFMAAASQHDDMTLVAIQVWPSVVAG